MQLVMRLSFTVAGAAYCLFHMRAPLLLSRPVLLAVSGLFVFSYLFFHYMASTRTHAAHRTRRLFLLDAAGSHMLWLLDPASPAPMMMMIMVTALGNSARHGFLVFRPLFRITMVTAPLVYFARVRIVGFDPNALLFVAMGAFLLIYTYILSRYNHNLQRHAEQKANDLVYTNARLKKTGEALQDSEARYRSMFENSSTPTVLIETNMRITMVNAKFEELTKYSKNELCNKKRLTEFIFQQDLYRIKRFHARRRSMGGIAPTEYECQLVDKYQKIKHVIIQFSVTSWHERIIATLIDITSRKHAKAALQKYNARLQDVARKLQESELRYRSLFENTGTATILVEKNMRISMANTKFSELTGYDKAQVTDQKRLTEFIERKNLFRIRRYHTRLKKQGLPMPNEYECLLVDKNKGMRHVVMTVHSPVGMQSSIVSFFDITKRKKAEAALQLAHQQLQQMAVSDELTQVANRRRFDECLNREWRRLQRENRPLALIMCDVDCFKAYNDTCGHQAGDKCLRAIADAIRANVKRAIDVVARYGGEEFAIIMPNTDAEGAVKIAENTRIAVEHLKLAHPDSSVSAFVTLSLGVSSRIPTSDQGPERLIKDADNALYTAKQKGRNRTVLGWPGEGGDPGHATWADNVIRIS
ncbi:MAG: diguanylate cyclase [Thermodesulfobacteriota bacterium]